MRRITVAGLLIGLCAAGRPAEAKLDPQEVMDRYRGVLTALATDGIEPALELLGPLEAAAVGEAPSKNSVDSFWKLKLAVIRDLLESEPIEVLVPIVIMHHEAYAHYLDKRQGLLAGHARAMSTELAEFYAKKAKTRQASIMAGWVLSSFGAKLQESRALRGSTEFYDRAVKLDASNRLALMNLAVNFEKFGDYRMAAQHFERLLEIWPDDREAMLRLANCRIRILPEMIDDIEELVRPKIYSALDTLSRGEDTPEWMRSIAYQEWARELENETDIEGAEALLREGMDALPGDQQIKVMLIAFLERNRRRTEANELLDELKANPPKGDSPRQIYDMYPHDGLEEARAELLAAMTENMLLLAQGIGADTAEVGAS